MYYILKIIILNSWLYHPRTAGALLIFNYLIKPFVHKMEFKEF